MNYLRIITDLLRMMLAIPLYLVALLLSGAATVFEYLADRVDVLDDRRKHDA